MHDDGRFEWDEDKAAINAARHGVSFEEAGEAFADNGHIASIHGAIESGIEAASDILDLDK